MSQIYNDIARMKGFMKHSGEIGLEIETEAKVPYKVPAMSYWSGTKDDSLRGPQPWEYILKQPLAYKTLFQEALLEFKDKTKGIDFDQQSFTTSIHVHLNMLNETYVTMVNYLTLYALVENLLKHFAGENRVSNLFCLPLCDAEDNFNNFADAVDLIKQRKLCNLGVNANSAKYAAMNMSSIMQHGSLECRLLRGTLDTAIINDWVGMLYAILEYSRDPKITPKHITTSWMEKGPKFLDEVFGDLRKHLKFDNEASLVERNFWYAINLSSKMNNWEILNKPEEKLQKLQSNNIDKISQAVFGKDFDFLADNQKAHIVMNYKEFAAGDLNKPKKGAHKLVDDPFNVGGLKPFTPKHLAFHNAPVAAGGDIDVVWNVNPAAEIQLDDQPEIDHAFLVENDEEEDDF